MLDLDDTWPGWLIIDMEEMDPEAGWLRLSQHTGRDKVTCNSALLPCYHVPKLTFTAGVLTAGQGIGSCASCTAEGAQDAAPFRANCPW